jgi:hypothetical protein
MEIEQRRNQPAAAVQAIEAAIEALRSVPETEIPANWRNWYLADLLLRLGVSQLQAGAVEESWTTAHQRADLLYAMAEREPGAGWLQNAAVTTLMQLGMSEAQRQRSGAALAAFQRATVLLEQGETTEGRSAERDVLLASAWSAVCDAQNFTTGAASGRQACERAVEMKRRAPRSLAADANLAWGLAAIADTRANVGDLDGAIAARREADELWRSVMTQNPSDGVARASLARNYTELARFPRSGVTWSAAATLWADLTSATLLSPIDFAMRDETNARAQQERELPENLRPLWREMLLHWHLAQRSAGQDDVAGAGRAFRAALNLATRLSERQPRNRQRQADEIGLKSIIANLPDAEFTFDEVAREWELFAAAHGPLPPAEAAVYQQILALAAGEQTVPAAILPQWRRMWLAVYSSNQRFGLNDMAGAIAARRRALDLSVAMIGQAPSRDRHVELAATQTVLAGMPDGGVSWGEVVATWREIEQRWGALAPQEREWLSDAERRATAGAP